MSDRECGPCTACCNAIPIHQPELDKPGFKPCPHLDPPCLIYRDRPPVCQAYECLWLTSDVLPDLYRPDLLGLIFDGTHGSAGDDLLEVGLMSCVAHEVWPGAYLEEFQQRVLAYFMEAFELVVLIHSSRHPDELVVYALTPERFQKVAELLGGVRAP